MSKERRSKTASKAATREVSRKRRESQFKLALHVTFSAKKNPNVDPKPVSNPFIVSKVYNARTSLETILEDLDNVVSLDTDFMNRFTKDYSVFDEVYGIKLWNAGGGKKKQSSSKELSGALQARLRKISSVTVKEGDGTNDISTWKNYIQNWPRWSPERDKNIKYLDVGIAIHKPAKSKISRTRSLSIGSQSGSIPKKQKKVTKQQPPPDRLRVHIMKPVHTAKKNLVLEIPDTTPLTSIDLDFTQHTVLDTISSIDNREGDRNSTSSDNDSTRSDERIISKLTYKLHGIIEPLRNEIARTILMNDKTKKVYANKLGERSGLYVTEKNRKAATGIASTKSFIDWIIKHGTFECLTNNDDDSDADDNVYIAEIRVAFGVVTENVKDPMQYFEEDFFDSTRNTQLEIDEPADEFDKKREAKKTKTFPAELRVLFTKMYTDEDNEFYQGFTHEMHRAASQYILSYVNTDAMDGFLEEYPPPDAFLEKCRESSFLQQHLKKFEWKKGLYPPTNVNAKQEPPTEREWKATPAGSAFMSNNPNENGSESALNRLITHITAAQTTPVPMQRGGSNAMDSVSEGCVRVTNSESGIFTDVHFGQQGSGFTLESKLREVLRSVRNHGTINRSTEERVFKVLMKSGEHSFYTSEDSKNVTLGFVVSSSGLSRGEILHVTTSKRDLQDSFDDVSLSP